MFSGMTYGAGGSPQFSTLLSSEKYKRDTEEIQQLCHFKWFIPSAQYYLKPDKVYMDISQTGWHQSPRIDDPPLHYKPTPPL